MSENLFRAKRIDNGEWLESSHAKEQDGKTFLFCPSANGPWVTLSWVQVERSTLCGYSGSKDANGDKIFELDILESRKNPHWRGVVLWKNDLEDFQITVFIPEGKELPKSYTPETGEWEIIGNYIDNPELVKGADHD